MVFKLKLANIFQTTTRGAVVLSTAKTHYRKNTLTYYLFFPFFSLQNDRITKLKIDNNPFAKGFRETGQSKCKRKISLSPTPSEENHNSSSHCDDDQSSVASSQDSPQAKRMCVREESLPYMDLNNVMRYTLQPTINDMISPAFFPQLAQQRMHIFMPALPSYMEPLSAPRLPFHNTSSDYDYTSVNEETSSIISSTNDDQNPELFVDVVSTSSEESQESEKVLTPLASPKNSARLSACEVPMKRSSFSISSILGSNKRNAVSV